MVLLMVLLAVVPLVVSYWLISLVAPWWVAVPTAVLVAVLVFCKNVKFKGES